MLSVVSAESHHDRWKLPNQSIAVLAAIAIRHTGAMITGLADQELDRESWLLERASALALPLQLDDHLTAIARVAGVVRQWRPRCTIGGGIGGNIQRR